MMRVFRLPAAMFCVAWGLTVPAAAQNAPTFTAAQAEAGRALYLQHCVACHGDTLQGGPFGPTLKGRAFQGRWGGAPLSELHAYLRRSMPPAAVGQLDEATYAAILARLMAENGAAPARSRWWAIRPCWPAWWFPGRRFPDNRSCAPAGS